MRVSTCIPNFTDIDQRNYGKPLLLYVIKCKTLDQFTQ